jgi:hypothetical protein
LVPHRAVATLVVFIPTNSGIVIAADSRHVIAGSFCDGETKIIVSPRSHLAAAAVTGMPIQYDFPIGGTNVYEIAKRAVRGFDANRLVLDFLNEHPIAIQDRDLQDLRSRCVHQLDAYFAKHPKAAVSEGIGDIFVVFIVAFDPISRVSLLCYFSVSISFLQHTVFSSELMFRNWSLEGVEDPIAVGGEKAFYDKFVAEGEGQRFIIHKPRATVAATDAAYGRLEAIDVLCATSRMAAEMRPPIGIGGPIDMAFVDGVSKIRPERIPNFDQKGPSTRRKRKS